MRAEEARLALLPEPVALSPYVEHVAVVQQPVQDGWAMTVSPSSSPHSPKPLVEVRMMLPRS